MEENKNLVLARNIAAEVCKLGGETYFVGGYVRDKLLGKESKDIDIEVYGVNASELENILDNLGGKTEFGKSFGIYGVKGYTLDVAFPRRERAIGIGHRDFQIETDPFSEPINAAKRRDFTINAFMENVLTGDILDFYGGIGDLKKRVLRHIDDRTFVEDPLRVFRGAQLAARLDFKVCDETIRLCETMDVSALSKERVEEELKKALITADNPRFFFDELREMNMLDFWFPEVKNLIGVEQNPEYHPEGDVYTHTMEVLDRAAQFRDVVSNPYGFMLTAITHDFGKPFCTEEKNGKITSYDHENIGVPIIKEFIERLTNDKQLKKYVLNMAKNHMRPNMLAAQNSSIKATNKMFDETISPDDIIYFSYADKRGSNALMPDFKNKGFLTERLKIYKDIMNKPYITGKDLIDAGLKEDKSFSEILKYVKKLRLSGVSKDSALKQAIAYSRNIKNM